MNHLKNPICDECKEEQDSFKRLKTLKGKSGKIYLCKKCYRENRIKFRNNTIEESGIKEDLKNLDRKIKRGYSPRKEKINEQEYIPKRYQIKTEQPPRESESPIKIKGSITKKQKIKSSSYLTLEESRDILRIFMSKGLNFNDAVEKKKELVKRLSETRKKLKEENKIEEIIKSKQEMLQELWNS